MLAIAVTVCSVDSSFAPGQAVTGALGANRQALISPASKGFDVGFCADLSVATLSGPLFVRTNIGSKHLPLLLAAYDAHDASSRSVLPMVNQCGHAHVSGTHTAGCCVRYMWQDAASVKHFIKKIPDEVHCLFMSYSGNACICTCFMRFCPKGLH